MSDNLQNNIVFYLDDDLPISGTSVAITKPVWETDHLVVTTPADITLISSDGKIVERMRITAAAGIMTIVARGIKKDASGDSDNALRKSWYANQKCFITVHSNHYVNAAGDNTFSGNNEFTGTNTFKWTTNFEWETNMKNVSDFNVEGKSNPAPVVADQTARDALYPAPVTNDRVYREDLHAEQIYDADMGQWNTQAVGTPPASATKTTEGIAQLATSAEALAWVNDTKIVTPAGLKAVTDSIPPASSFIITSDYPQWEATTDITKTCFFKETAPTFAQATQVQNIWDVAGNTRVSFPAIGTGVAGNSLKLSLAKVLSPSAFLRVRIETDNAGSPSGTLVDANATKDIDPATLTTSLADTTVLMWATVANAHWVTLNVNETSQTVYKWVKFTLTQQVWAVSVDKVAGCTATKAYLYDMSWNLLTSASFSTNTATLNYNGLVNGQSYYIMAGSDGSSYTSVKQTGASAYPYTAGRLNYVWWSTRNLWATDTFNWAAQGTAAFDPAQHELVFTVTKSCKLVSISSWLWVSWNAILKDSTWTITIETASWVTFSWNTILQQWTTYKLVWNIWQLLTYSYYTAPSVWWWTNISYVSSTPYYPWAGWRYPQYIVTTWEYLLPTTDINNITSISTLDTILIPNGQKVHTVVSAVWDVVNASNYYKIGYSTNDTTTRGLSKRNTTRWTATSTIFPYISSTLFHNTVLSLTDSDFAYKVDLYGIATAVGAVGSYPKLYLPVDGAIVPNFTTTEWQDQFLSWTPWAISSTAGTNKYKIGVGKYWYMMLDWTLVNAWTNILGSSTVQKSVSNTWSYILLKSIRAKFSWTYTIAFTGVTWRPWWYWDWYFYFRIYKNWIAVWTARSNNVDTTYTEDLAFSAWDTIEIRWYAASATYPAGLKDFYVKWVLYKSSQVAPSILD